MTMWAEGHRLKQFNFYVQDEWKIRQNVTLNYGVRWAVNLTPTEAGGRVYIGRRPGEQVLSGAGRFAQGASDPCANGSVVVELDFADPAFQRLHARMVSRFDM